MTTPPFITYITTHFCLPTPTLFIYTTTYLCLKQIFILFFLKNTFMWKENSKIFSSLNILILNNENHGKRCKLKGNTVHVYEQQIYITIIIYLNTTIKMITIYNLVLTITGVLRWMLTWGSLFNCTSSTYRLAQDGGGEVRQPHKMAVAFQYWHFG